MSIQSFDQNRKIVLYGIIISIGILLCLSGYSIYLSKRLTRPLLHMVNAADRIAKGNFEHRLAISSMDEIGHFSHSFNRMMESLAEAEKALKQSTDRLLLIMDSHRCRHLCGRYSDLRSLVHEQGHAEEFRKRFDRAHLLCRFPQRKPTLRALHEQQTPGRRRQYRPGLQLGVHESDHR